ncbi:MAG: sugar ABC transporter ATP-binding protein, partial [Polyangiaceae bacterium]
MTPLVELRDLTVTFGATRALSHVDLTVHPGEIHVLAGENGAGKSTLIRVLSGVVSPREGSLFVKGERVHFRSARDAARHGIATIHQELSLVGSMTVADNLALPSSASLFSLVRPRADLAAARALLARMDLDLDPTALVETLPLASRQLLEIARALARDARVLILDEPTSALSELEADRLLTRVESLAKSGCGVLYISHRMEENDRLADRITVLCDGEVVACRPAADLPREELVALMMGRGSSRAAAPAPASARDAGERALLGEGGARRGGGPAPLGEGHRVDAEAPQRNEGDARGSPDGGAPALDVRDLFLAAPGRAMLHGVSFSIARGEILGLAGLRGAGASEVLAALFGVFGAAVSARVSVRGEEYEIESPARSIAQGVIYLANDRKKTVLHDLDIESNVTLSSLARVSPGGVLSPAREAGVAEGMTARLRVAAPSLRTAAGALSGGNQQKVALLRCLAAGPRVLLLDEPTRGVDIGAKAEIHGAL